MKPLCIGVSWSIPHIHWKDWNVCMYMCMKPLLYGTLQSTICIGALWGLRSFIQNPLPRDFAKPLLGSSAKPLTYSPLPSQRLGDFDSKDLWRILYTYMCTFCLCSYRYRGCSTITLGSLWSFLYIEASSSPSLMGLGWGVNVVKECFP